MRDADSDDAALLRSNDRIFALFPPDHPAKKYLVNFYEVQQLVCGRDIEWPERPRVEQQWNSDLLRRPFSFSMFAYAFLGFSLDMEEWFESRFESELSPWEVTSIGRYSMKQTLLDECEHNAKRAANFEILRYIELARSVLKLEAEAVAHRVGIRPDDLILRWAMDPHVAAIAWANANFPRKSNKSTTDS